MDSLARMMKTDARDMPIQASSGRRKHRSAWWKHALAGASLSDDVTEPQDCVAIYSERNAILDGNRHGRAHSPIIGDVQWKPSNHWKLPSPRCPATTTLDVPWAWT